MLLQPIPGDLHQDGTIRRAEEIAIRHHPMTGIDPDDRSNSFRKSEDSHYTCRRFEKCAHVERPRALTVKRCGFAGSASSRPSLTSGWIQLAPMALSGATPATTRRQPIVPRSVMSRSRYPPRGWSPWRPNMKRQQDQNAFRGRGGMSTHSSGPRRRFRRRSHVISAHLRSLACRTLQCPRDGSGGIDGVADSDRSDPWPRCPELLLGNWPFDADLPQESAGAGSRNAAPRIRHPAPFHDVGDGVLADAQLSADQPIAPAGVDQGEDLGAKRSDFGRWPSCRPSTCLSPSQRRDPIAPAPEEDPFELGNTGQHCSHHAPGRARQIEGHAAQRHHRHPSRLQVASRATAISYGSVLHAKLTLGIWGP